MRNLIKNKKKKGFTLIEMVAVVAIIGILAAILVPKITGYLNEAKKTAVIDQSRKVAQAYETAVMKNTLKIKGKSDLSPGTTLSDALNVTNGEGNTTMKSLVSDADLSNLGFVINATTGNQGTNQATITVEHCLAITKGSDFEVEKNSSTGNLEVKTSSIDLSYASR